MEKRTQNGVQSAMISVNFTIFEVNFGNRHSSRGCTGVFLHRGVQFGTPRSTSIYLVPHSRKVRKPFRKRRIYSVFSEIETEKAK